MEVKKNKKVDVKNFRVIFFLIGMNISLGSVYAIMEYKKYEPIEKEELEMEYEEDMMVMDQTQQIQKPPPPDEPPPQDPIIEVVDDEKEITETPDISIETSDDDAFGEIQLPIDEGPVNTGEVFEWYQVQSVASFPGGEEAMDNFINQNIVIPDIAFEEAESGTVVVGFTVETDGRLTDLKILSKREIGFGVEAAVLDVFRKMPKWNPALQRDKPARMRFNKPVRLQLN